MIGVARQMKWRNTLSRAKYGVTPCLCFFDAPMRFTVITYGTEGDTRPLVAVCRGLLQAGHDVSLLADRSTLGTAQAHAVPAYALSGDMKATVGPGGALSKLMRTGGDVTQVAKAVARIANENTSSWMREVGQQAARSDAILFSGIASYVGLSVAEQLRIPAVGLGLWPVVCPTREFPSPLLPPWKMPGWLNRVSHEAVGALTWTLFRAKINAARAEVFGQAPRRRMWRDYPILFGISRHLLPQPSDWQDIWKICGAWPLASRRWEMPPTLKQFLAAGEPPIYVGFGSMSGFDSGKLLAIIVDAVAGRRALFYPGWSGIDGAALPGNFCVLGDTPHDLLFPRASVVIHHGGAGTSHTACRAGVPSVVVPFTGDQFFWAGRLAAAGVAPQYIPHTKINAQALSSMIACAGSPQVARRAQALGRAMQEEDGVACAVEHIERFAASSAP